MTECKKVATAALALATITMWAPATAAVPGQVTYTGHLTKSGQPVTTSSPLKVVFKIFANPTGGLVPLWEEAHTGVSVSGGTFSRVLGKTKPLTSKVFDGSPRYMEIVLGAQTMTPRLPLGSTPYAVTADNCIGNITPKTVTSSGGITVDPSGTDPSKIYLRTAKTTDRDAKIYTHANGSTLSLASSNTRKDLHINAGGRVGIGTTKPRSALDVAGVATVGSPFQMTPHLYGPGITKYDVIKKKFVDMTLPHGHSPGVISAGAWSSYLFAVLTIVTKNPTDGRYQYVGAWTKPGGNVPANFYSPTGSKLAGFTFRRSAAADAYFLNTSGSTQRVVGLIYYH